MNFFKSSCLVKIQIVNFAKNTKNEDCIAYYWKDKRKVFGGGDFSVLKEIETLYSI